jgi:Lamin Tail Domain
MRRNQLFPLFGSIALVAALSPPAQAAIVVSEVDPYGSAASYKADWFVLTNTGTSSVDITGWTMTDNHAASNTTTPYASGATVSIANLTGTSKTFGPAFLTLAGGTTIDAGQSAIFLESSADAAGSAALIASFEAAWYGSNVPANLLIGTYNDGTGTVFGLSQTADMVNVFNGSSTTSSLVASVAVGADTGAPIATFDNSAGLNNSTLTQKSVVGVNGAQLSVSGAEIGVLPAPVPEPAEWMLLVGGLGLLGSLGKRRSRAAQA